ncbi:putative bifunctional diguanylate cyclase/phosphodiesterase [Blastococcus deserti]|uniref:Bifunctional diguanylate cyclase/phosphodiesterase n=1 Tax=Blastococcus deserti TaxID=2259033 RepID=A0ABW4X8G2_9ACTN
MDPRRTVLLGCAALGLTGCAAAVAVPSWLPVADAGVAAVGLIVSVLLWSVGSSSGRGLRGWRLLALAPPLPVAGTALAYLLRPADGIDLAVLRWVPTVPGYVIAIVAILTLVERCRLRAGPRVAVELALFTSACLVAVQMMIVGPRGSWADLELAEGLVLGAAVVATSVTMAAAVTVLGVVDVRRRRMALVLLAGAVLLTTGRALATSALMSGSSGVLDGSRFLVVCGLSLLGLAALMDPGPAREPADRHPDAGGRATDLGHVLPHLAMLLAMTVAGVVTMLGSLPSQVTVTGVLACAGLATAHRVLALREERRTAARLRRSEAYFRSLVHSSGDGVVILDDALRINWTSPALERALGNPAPTLLGRLLLEAVHPDDVPALAAVLPVAGIAPDADPGGAGLLTVRLPDAAGEWHYLEAGVSDLRRHPDVGAVVLHCRDMTERNAREQALQAVAYTDPMTGLPNRAGVLRLLQDAVTGPGGPTTLLMVDLLGLTAARENAGRETGTLAVAEIGRRLRATVRGEDTVARMGGGAFAVLSHGADADADRLAHRCLSAVEQPIVTPAGLVELTAGIGVVDIEQGSDVEAVLARADLAVRAAHEAGAGRARRYDDALGEAAARRDLLRSELAGAAARDELYLLFQPIVSLEEERITGVEAQLRWRHGSLGEIPPVEFVPLAERAGLIGGLVRWGLEAAATAATGLPEAGTPLRIGFTVPFGYLSGGTLVTDVESALAVSGLSPERLVLQIGAPAVASDDERLALDVSSVRLMGVHVALDGFGSGASALAHLTRLPIDIVRLDRSLISRIDRDPQSQALCESVIGIARALGLDVVGEGVETAAQLAALTKYGCGFAQGFAVGRPLPLPGITELVAEGAAVLLPGLVGSR